MPTAAPSPSPARNQPILLLRSSDIEPPNDVRTKVNVSTRIVFLQIVRLRLKVCWRGVAGLRGFIYKHTVEPWIKGIRVIGQLFDLLEAHRVAAVDALRK